MTPAKKERMSKKEKKLQVTDINANQSPPKTPVKIQPSNTSPTLIPQPKEIPQEEKSENNMPAYVKSPTVTSSKAAITKKSTTPIT